MLILGVGSGTKSLNQFLACTKSYETVVLFGAATDSYDTEGKIVARKGYEHVTREKVEVALEGFRGEVMQRPPIFSAKRIRGKRLYEYAREGVPLPEGYKIEECKVEVEGLEMVEWLEGGSHGFGWPEEEAERGEREIAERVLHLGGEGTDRKEGGEAEGGVDGTAGAKRKREDEMVGGAITPAGPPSPKRTKSSPLPEPEEAITPGALPNTTPTNNATPITSTTSAPATTSTADPAAESTQPTGQRPPCPAPAARLRMTVTSGFYVRSLCHDLGAAVGSLGIMASLVRTRQAEFELGVNTLWYEDLGLGEEVWGPKVGGMLGSWGGGGGKAEGVVRKENEEKEEEEVGNEVDGVVEGGGGKKEWRKDAKPAVRARLRRNTSSEEEG